jgi:SET domain-containing protein
MRHQTGTRGWGLKTTVPIKEGELIIEYRGEVVSEKTCLERIKSRPNSKNLYFLSYNNGEVLDASEKGTDARFINHR